MQPKTGRATGGAPGAASLKTVAKQSSMRSLLEERQPGVVSLSARVLAPKPKSPKNNSVHPVPHPPTPEGPPHSSSSFVHPFSADTSANFEDI
eukprot:2558772-Rhodomonas_salina.1